MTNSLCISHPDYETLLKALNTTKKSKYSVVYDMMHVYDYRDFYYFSCRRRKDGQAGNGPCVDKKTLKEIPVDSVYLVTLPFREICSVEDLKKVKE